MPYFDLTLPLNHEWMPDEVFPNSTRFFLGPKDHHEKGIVVGSESGTCITLPAEFAEFRKTMRLDEVPAEKLFLRATTIVEIPKKGGEEVTEEDIRRSLSEANPNPGDAILLRTGWGDTGVETQPGDSYVLKSPHFSLKAAEFLASEMKGEDSDLLLTDSAVIGWPNKHLIPEWCSIRPRPSPWPSPEARVYLHLYTPEKAKEDFAVEILFAAAGIMTVKRLIRCGAIQQKSVRIIVAPLHIVRGVSSSCRVIAVVDS